MSHEPQPGEVGGLLPGTTYLTCPICHATTTVFHATFPYDLTPCLGCGRNWRIHEAPTSYIWTPLTIVVKEI